MNTTQDTSAADAAFRARLEPALSLDDLHQRARKAFEVALGCCDQEGRIVRAGQRDLFDRACRRMVERWEQYDDLAAEYGATAPGWLYQERIDHFWLLSDIGMNGRAGTAGGDLHEELHPAYMRQVEQREAAKRANG